MKYQNTTIVADTMNRQGCHPEIQQLKNMGFDILMAPLPVADYAVMSPEFKEILRTRNVEQFCQHHYKDKDIPINISRIDFAGTYNKAVDVKRKVIELYANLVLIEDRYRFERELIRARNMGIHLLVLLTDQNYRSRNDILMFESPYGYKDAGFQMVERMEKLEKEYPVKFDFLHAGEEAGQKIADFLLASETQKEKYQDASCLEILPWEEDFVIKGNRP